MHIVVCGKKRVVGNVILPAEISLTLSYKTFAVCTYSILEIFVIAKEEMHQQLHHCIGVAEFNQVESKQGCGSGTGAESWYLSWSRSSSGFEFLPRYEHF